MATDIVLGTDAERVWNADGSWTVIVDEATAADALNWQLVRAAGDAAPILKHPINNYIRNLITR